GTSAISSMLVKLGINFGHAESFIDPGIYDHNPRGFFELAWVNELNDQIFSYLGSHWLTLELFGDDSLSGPRLDQFRNTIQQAVLKEWGEHCPMIGIKDPRISLLFPVWESAFTRMGYELRCVIALRHPLGFARSQANLTTTWSLERLLLEWVRHMLSSV